MITVKKNNYFPKNKGNIMHTIYLHIIHPVATVCVPMTFGSYKKYYDLSTISYLIV